VTVDPQTRAVPVVFEVTNPLNRLRDGMFVEITIDTTGNNTVLSVPKQADIPNKGARMFTSSKWARSSRRSAGHPACCN